ncbi:MAG: ABC transporter ATP-binding protein [bacterium]|nr:ABC transporter ATP-binding protein [bacterium]
MSIYQNKITLSHIKKSFGTAEILKDISLEVKEGQVVALLGPSGSGKSTIFNLITGLIVPEEGTIDVNGKVGYMYQNDTMVPWKKVIDNIALPLRFQGMKKREAREKVVGYLDTFGLLGYEDKYPGMLSGGMKQRANFLKTYLTSGDIILLDEPFGALDSMTRKKMQSWLLSVTKEMGATILLITHDIEEAIFLADKVYVLSDKPATILGEVQVAFDAERTEATLLEERFLLYKKEITDILQS